MPVSPQRPEIVLLDAGYWHKRQMERIVSDGLQVLVPPDSGLQVDVRPGWDKGMFASMRRVLASDYGYAIYEHPKATVEAVFAQIKFHRMTTRVQRRGRAAALSEWRLIVVTENLMKLHKRWMAHRDRLRRQRGDVFHRSSRAATRECRSCPTTTAQRENGRLDQPRRR